MIENTSSPSFLPSRLAAVVLDWAGTTVDFGSRAPVLAIRAAFEQVGVPVSESEARGPMGRAKRDHLQEMLNQSGLASRWRKVYGSTPDNAAVDILFQQFLSLQAECVLTNSQIIDGCVEAVGACRQQGLKVGSSTGYGSDLLGPVAEQAAQAGYRPDVMLSADDVSPGRPAPWLCLENARRLGVYPMAAVVKVDDTPAGITAGRNAGAWAVGVVVSGNEVGVDKATLDSLEEQDREQRLSTAGERLKKAGAHLLIDTIVELPTVIEKINAWLACGVAPDSSR